MGLNTIPGGFTHKKASALEALIHELTFTMILIKMKEQQHMPGYLAKLLRFNYISIDVFKNL